MSTRCLTKVLSFKEICIHQYYFSRSFVTRVRRSRSWNSRGKSHKCTAFEAQRPVKIFYMAKIHVKISPEYLNAGGIMDQDSVNRRMIICQDNLPNILTAKPPKRPFWLYVPSWPLTNSLIWSQPVLKRHLFPEKFCQLDAQVSVKNNFCLWYGAMEPTMMQSMRNCKSNERYAIWLEFCWLLNFGKLSYLTRI